MEKALALYIDDLESGRKQTKWAEDRKLYEAYLAQAACILSKVILQAPENELFEAIDTNEKLWGNSWLKGVWVQKNSNSYKEFKRLARYPGYGNT